MSGRAIPCILVFAAIAAAPLLPQPPPAPPADRDFEFESLRKAVDDLMWHAKLGDIAEVDKVAYTSLPPAKVTNPSAAGAQNPLIINAYTFVPRNLVRGGRHPLIVLVHGGVHANFSTGSAHIVREFVGQGYSVIATD